MTRRNYLVFAVFAICVLFLPLYHHFFFSDYTCPEAGYRSSKNRPKAESQDYVETLLEMTRSMIKLEMWDYNFSLSGVERLEDLLPEAGGTPIRSVVVSAWRSGSNFFGDLLDAVPGTFYSHEPIAVFTLDHLIRGPPYEVRANRLIKNILRCKLDSDIVDYYAFAKQHVKEIDLMKRNKRFWEKCNLKPDLCFDAEVGTKFCKLFPFQAMKLDRFRLPHMRTLMEDKELNVKVVLLIRDPRGVLQSRLHIKDFCSAHRHDNYTGPYEAVPECADPAVVCSDMVKDYEAAVDFLQRYPGRFMLNLKVVLLVRDPRGVFQSRWHIRKFCFLHRHQKNYTGPDEIVPDCADPAVVCADMVRDYEAAADFLQRYPGRFMALRYEDLALDLESRTREVLSLLGIQFTAAMADFLQSHSNSSDARPYTTFRVTREVPFKWKHLMTFDEVTKVQEKCSEAMSLWGYEPAQNASHMVSADFNPVSSYSIDSIPRLITE